MKYVLCRPSGGLVDNLCRIAACYQYAKKHNRTLLIDTRTSSGFFDQFDNYFTILTEKSEVEIITLNNELEDTLNTMTLFPIQLNFDAKGRSWARKYPMLFSVCNKLFLMVLKKNRKKLSYQFKYDTIKRNFTEIVSGEKLTFDFDLSYDESILLHHQCGSCGVKMLLPLFSIIRFSTQVIQFINERMKLLGQEPYDAIHVRHTDYRGDYQEFFSSIRPSMDGKRLLVCSDSQEVLDEARNFFNKSKVLTTNSTASDSQKPLHHHKKTIAKKIGEPLFTLNAEAIFDLIAISGAQELHLSPVKLDGGIITSGYQRLADFLHGNKEIRSALLSP